MEFGWTEIINVIMIFQLLVFTVFLFVKQKHSVSNYILGVHLFSQAIVIFSFFQKNLLSDNYPHLSFIGFPFAFLWGPTFYLYVKSITSKEFRLNWKNLLHIIPFILIVLFFSFSFYFYSAETKRIILRDSSNPILSHYLLIDIFLRLHVLFYIIKSFQILYFLRNSIKENYSSKIKGSTSWLILILVCYSICYFASVSLIYIEYLYTDSSGLFHLIVYLLFFIYFNIILFKAWYHPQIFTVIEETQKYKYSRLTKDEAEYWLEKLNANISVNKSYLDPELTLDQLADTIKVNPKILSQVINEYLNINIFDFINRMRIEESKRMLIDSSCKKNILEIQFETGFNSKATFNRAFKKETGLTPTEYRKKFTNETLSPE